MAKVHVTLARVGARADTGSTLPITDAEPVAAKTIDTTGASQDTTLVAVEGTVWTITASGGPVWAAFGTAPAAGPDTGWMIGNGETRSFGAKAGQRLAVRDVA